MRTLFAVLALTALVAACADQPSGPMVPESGIEIAAPSLAKFKPDTNPGAFNEWWNFCFLPDAEGHSFPQALPCHFIAVPGPREVWTLHAYASGVPNPTGKAYHFGPTNYTPGMEAMCYSLSGGLVTPVDGKMPACDHNLVTDPAHSFKVPCNRCWG